MLLNRYQQIFEAISTTSENLKRSTRDSEDQLLRYVIPYTLGIVAQQYPDQQQGQRTKWLLKYIHEIERSLETCRALSDIGQERVIRLINETTNNEPNYCNNNTTLNDENCSEELTLSDNIPLLEVATEIRKSLKRSHDLISTALLKVETTPFSFLDRLSMEAMISQARERDAITQLLAEGEEVINNAIRKDLIELVLDRHVFAERATLESKVPHTSQVLQRPFVLEEEMQRHIAEQQLTMSELNKKILDKKAMNKEVGAFHHRLINDIDILHSAHEELDRILNKRLVDIDDEFSSKTKGIIEQYSNELQPLETELRELTKLLDSKTNEERQMDADVRSLKLMYESQRLALVEEVHALEKQIAEMTEIPELVNFGLMASGTSDSVRSAFKKVLKEKQRP